MKNLFIFISPTKSFNNPRHDLISDAGILVKVQIKNSQQLGWKKEDILYVTDLPYEYNDVKSQVIPNGMYYEFDKMANKSKVLVYLLNQ